MQYIELAELYEKLESTTKRLEKTELIKEFLKKLKHEKNKEVIYLLQGRIYPDDNEAELGISNQLAIKAISKSSGLSKEEITKKFKLIGDLGNITQEIISKKKQSSLYKKSLTVEKVLDNLRKISLFEGKGTVDKKLSLVSELLTNASALEAKYITRTLLSTLRIGVGESTLRDAIVSVCYKSGDKKEYINKIQRAYDQSIDFSVVFEAACKNKLDRIKLSPGRPLKVMLALKAENVEDGFKRVGKPAAFEYKYDGFRLMINKDEKGEIKLFTRRLENVTKQFPEVKDYVKKYVSGKSFILDSEAVGYDKKKKQYMPFQSISQRIRRKYDIEKVAKELPVELNVFDILYYNGKSLIDSEFKERRKLIEKIIKKQKWKIQLSQQLITSDDKKAEEFYKKSLKEGEEGVMIKNLNSPYKPGARVGYMLKLKPSENEFDLAIVKAEYGTGKRAGWLTSYTVACKSGDELLEIGKVSTGLKEKESEGLSYKEMTKKLKPLIEKAKGKEVSVKAKLIVTVTYQNIQKSPNYKSGFALRFPRFTALRPDRNIKDIATLKEITDEHNKRMIEIYSY